MLIYTHIDIKMEVKKKYHVSIVTIRRFANILKQRINLG